MRSPEKILTVVAVAALLSTGCVTSKKMESYVDSEVGAVNSRVDDVQGQVEQNQDRLDDHESQIEDMSTTARDALERAEAAGKLAEGKLVHETVMSDAAVSFGFDKAGLTDEGEAALEAFSSRLKEENANVWIEIQGHTDSIGSESYNYELGLERAEAVRRYLAMHGGLPLHRMSAISYGETEPVADNGTREGRSENRRVVLVVLK